VRAGDWIAVLALVISTGVPIALLIAKKWILARVEKGVEHRFNTELEGIRSDLRKNEERFKSDLAAKESEISIIRTTVLGGSANRQALVDKRRVEAVERVWAAVIDLAPYKNVAASMAVFKIGPSSKRAANDPKIREMFKVLGSDAPHDGLKKIDASKEQPFVSPLAWAYFAAYRTVIASSFMQLKALELGIDAVDEMLDKDHIRKVLKAALPNYSGFIDGHEPNTYYHLLEDIENRLLNELKEMLQGNDVDMAGITKASEIMSAVKELDAAAESAKSDV
jgi:DNA-binding protein Fis